MTKIQFITSALGASLLTGAACAGVDGFLGYSGEISSYQDFTVIDMYAEFSSDDYVVLNVFNATITLSDGSGFNHNDLADPQGGSWKPSFSFEYVLVIIPARIFLQSPKSKYVTKTTNSLPLLLYCLLIPFFTIPKNTFHAILVLDI